MTDSSSPPAQAAESGFRSSWVPPIIGSVLLLLPLVTTVQAWLADAPGKIWLTILAAAAMVLGIIAWRFRRSLVLWFGLVATSVLIVVPAYLYGVDGAELAIAGVPYNTFIPILFLVSLAVAAWELARLPRLPLWARLIAPALAVFATVPVVMGLIDGVPFAEVLVGLWTLPYWTQGAWFGAAILLPIALIVAVLRAVVPAWRSEPFRASVALGIIAIFLAAMLATGFTMTARGLIHTMAFVPVPGYQVTIPAVDATPAKAVADVSEPIESVPDTLAQESTPSNLPPLDLPQPGEDWLDRYAQLDLDAAFDAVAQGIRYEPYYGVLRGAAGTALARSGNSLDQSSLLADVLRDNGFKVRFVTGSLAGGNLEAVLRGIYPPDMPDLEIGAEYAPYVPAKDRELRAAAADHFWVEVFQAGGWLPLDPSFPRAKPGEAYGQASARFDQIPEELFQILTMTLKQESRDGEVRELGTLEEKVADLGLTPVALMIHRVPKSSAEPARSSASTGGMLGGLGGSLAAGESEEQAEEPAPTIVAVEYQRELFLRGEHVQWESTVVAEEERDNFITREWLEFRLSAPGSAPLHTERVLFLRQQPEAQEPSAVRHYSISVVPGPVYDEWLEAERARIGTHLDLRAWNRDLSNASGLEPGSEEAASIAPALRQRANLAGIAGGHLVGLTYAAESDTISRQVGRANGVALLWPIPRILITSVETESLERGGAESRVTLDLRLDKVKAIPYPGFPSRSAQLFQSARGLQNTILEGAVVGRATGMTAPVTTAVLMIRAAKDGTPLLAIGPANADDIGRLDGLPTYCADLIKEALARGHEVIVPQLAASIGGKEHWGWWQVNTETGEIIGVMEDGQHQATASYTIDLSKVSLDDRSGFAIGAITGASGTLFVISGLMLEYGEASAAMIEDVEKYVKSIMCSSCPSKAEATASASVGVSAGGDCLQWEQSLKAEAGAAASISFCENYQKGFTCAAGMLLRGLRGETGTDFSFSASGKADADAGIVCE